MSQQTASSQGLGCTTALGLIFITLKLTHVIAWSWVWVLAPFWIPAAIVLLVLLACLAIALWAK